MTMTLADVYGGGAAPQPVSTGGPAVVPVASPARTTGRGGLANDPTLLLVVFVGLFLGLVHFSVGLGR